MITTDNELHPELVSVAGMNPLMAHIASSRQAMYTGNLSQFLVVKGATRRFLQSGMEGAAGSATFSLGFDKPSEIFAVIPRYPRTEGSDAIRYNPQTIVIYEDRTNGQICMLDLVKHNSIHQHFGFEYERNEEVYASLVKGATIPEGTTVAQSPIVTPEGDYMPGVETNVAFMSDAAGIEDGVKTHDEWLDKITPTGFETHQLGFGKQAMPINLYGSLGRYQPFPDIGQQIHSDGLLAAMREYDDVLNVVNMTPSALCSCDYIYDHKDYAEPNATVIDIRVERNTSIQIPPVPVGMEDQLMKYWNADTTFYKKILDAYWDLRRQRSRLDLHPDLSRLIVEAIDRVGTDYHPRNMRFDDREMEKIEKHKVNKVYRNVPLDAWRVEITYRKHSKPNVGFKVTDCHGGKGVICSVVPKADMPVDENGNVVDVVMDWQSTVRRTNVGRFYEQYYNAAGRDVVVRIKRELGFDPENMSRSAVKQFFRDPRNRDAIYQAYDYVMGFYQIIVPRQHEIMVSDAFLDWPNAREEHIESICQHGVFLRFPPNNPIDRPESIRQLNKLYPPFKTPVTFRGMGGDMVTTKVPVLIGSMYFLVLEKTAEDWSAVSSAKLQHYGTTARLTNRDKNSAPGRLQVTKTIGEAESRLLAAACGGEVTADIMDANNNPLAHKAYQRSILTADEPTNIDVGLDRNAIPKGGHRPLAYLKHIFQCSGKSFANH